MKVRLLRLALMIVGCAEFFRGQICLLIGSAAMNDGSWKTPVLPRLTRIQAAFLEIEKRDPGN